MYAGIFTYVLRLYVNHPWIGNKKSFWSHGSVDPSSWKCATFPNPNLTGQEKPPAWHEIEVGLAGSKIRRWKTTCQKDICPTRWAPTN